MFDDKTIQLSRRLSQRWQQGTQKYREREYRSHSGLPIFPVYSPLDIADMDFADIGLPGGYPYTRGIYPFHYQFQPWMMQQVLGYGLAEDTRARMDLMVREGMEGYFGYPVFNIVLDNPSQGGIDPDRPEARGHVGVCGVSFSSLRDMEALVKGLPLDKVNFSLITGDTCLVLLACYIAAAEKEGYPMQTLKGNSMNWLLKGFCVDNPTFSPQGACTLSAQLIRFCTKNMPSWNTTNLSSYLIRAAGSNAVQELAFILQWGIAVIEATVATGLHVDEFVPRFGFQVCVHNDFFEEIAKIRALRKLWATTLRERFGSDNPKSQMARIHVHTAGDSLTAQQPLNNAVRTTLQSLAAILAGTNSLHTCGYDETLGLPTEESARLSLRTQQIMLYESNIPSVTDPLAGSYYLEDLTRKMEAAALHLIRQIDELGGFVKAIESGWLREHIAREAYHGYEAVRKGERAVVGVNKYAGGERVTPPVFRIDPGVEREACARIARLKQERDNGQVQTCLQQVRRATQAGEELMPAILAAVRSYATQGEVMDILKEVYGWGYVP